MTNRNFNDVENVTLRTWNRCAMCYNLKEDKGEDAVEKYCSQFDKRTIKQMYLMFDYINAKGYEAVKREVHRGVQE